MPGPEPNTIHFEKYDGQPFTYFVQYPWPGKSRHRNKRASTITARMHNGTWRCNWCWDAVPEWRRADAEYCCEGCRKRAARKRRVLRERAKVDVKKLFH